MFQADRPRQSRDLVFPVLYDEPNRVVRICERPQRVKRRRLVGSRFSVEIIPRHIIKRAARNLGLEAAGIEMKDGGMKADANLLTTNPNVYAAGDVVSPEKYTHAAMATARLCVANAFGSPALEYSGRLPNHASGR